jgi:4-hydroxyphenylpyruvate dioxygenase-like putative hemolysin
LKRSVTGEKEREDNMPEQKPNKENSTILKSDNFCQIGIVVKNIDRTVKYYRDVFGFGPSETRQVACPTATYHGETAGYRGKRASFYLGSIQIELIELADGKTIHEDFLKEKGEGIHHIAVRVPSL